jgi:hypothetical protein
MGMGLDGLLRHRSDALTGILNGIDPDVWNPATDTRLIARYDVTRLDDRARNKKAVRQRFGLNDDESGPLVAVVSRLELLPEGGAADTVDLMTSDRQRIPEVLLSLPFEFGLTLVFNQCRLTEGLRQFLDASSNANQFVVQGGRFVNPFCSVALHTERVIGESAAFASIKLPLWPIRTEIAFLDFSTEEEIGKEFQAKLLTFRLSNVQVARKCNFDPSELSSPSRETARSLGACYSGDPDLQREIVSLLRDADAQARVRSSTCQEAVVVEAMLFLCHEKNGDKGGNLRVSEIADAVRVINIGREEITSPSPRGVGEILRALGFETTKLDKKGRGIILCRDIDRRVHEVAFNFGVPSLWKGMPNCVGCKSVWEGSDGRGGEQ